MKKNYVTIIFFLFLINSISFACTIGVASGSATTDGRALLWKNRDVSAPVYVHYFNDADYKFIGVGNEESDYIWMGVNEAGFAILNALANFNAEGSGRMGNGDTMKWALGHFATVEEFDAFLDSTNITGRETHANMGVIDSTGKAIMYEISENNYWKFDTADTEEGFVVRGNFAFNGGGTTSPTYERSNEIIHNLIAENNLNCQSILHFQIREFCDNNGEHIPVPFAGNWNDGIPYGYIPIQGISNSGNSSAVVIQGNLPNEPSYFATMWTLLGQPTAAIAVPCFPVGAPPLETNNNETAPLFAASQNIKNILFDYTSPNYVDTYKLVNDSSSGFWTQLFAEENNMVNQIDTLKTEWLSSENPIEEIMETQNEFSANALQFLQNVEIETAVIPNFKADIRYGISGLEVQFTDISLHNPQFTFWNWDFDNDGETDSEEQNPSYTFSQTGNFTVTMIAGNNDTTVSVSKPDFIHVYESAAEIISVSPDSLLYLTIEDADLGLSVVIKNNLDFEIEISEIEPICCYIEPFELEFPATILPQDSLSLIYHLIMPVDNFHREIVAVDSYIETSNAVYVLPIYYDSDLWNSAENNAIESGFFLSNFPNPFTASTTISFSVSNEQNRQNEQNTISIYNIKGQKIRTLECINQVDAKTTKSFYSTIWDGTDNFGEKVSPGIYFYKLKDKNGRFTSTKKMILMK